MILNTLHAITLALSVGLNATKTYNYNKNQELKEQRATQSNSFTLGQTLLYDEWEQTTQTINVYQNIPLGTRSDVVIKYDYQRFSFNNSYISVEGIWIRETPTGMTYPQNGTLNYNTWIGADGVEMGHTSNPKAYLYAGPQPITPMQLSVPAVAQEMIMYKIMPTGNNINNVTEYVEKYIIDAQTNNLGMYTKRFSTRSSYMEQYFTHGNIDITKYIKNNNLYDKLIEMISQSGYTSYVKDEHINYNTDWNYASPTQIIMNSTNYYACYIEPKTKNALTPNTLNTDYVWDLQEEVEIVITGTNVVVSNSQEIVDIPGVMFTVLGMPFTFISTAFNLTLFPGTAYELNISLLFLSIFAVIVFIFLIKFILAKVGK